MSDLPQVSGARVVRALERAGFVQLRQVGSHVTLRHRADPTRRATVDSIWTLTLVCYLALTQGLKVWLLRQRWI